MERKCPYRFYIKALPNLMVKPPFSSSESRRLPHFPPHSTTVGQLTHFNQFTLQYALQPAILIQANIDNTILAMARSTLFVLLVLALIQVALAAPYGVYLIVNKAANGTLRGHEKFQPLTVHRDDLSPIRWKIASNDKGTRILTFNHHYFISDHKWVAILTRDRQYFRFEEVGNDICKIKHLTYDKVLTWIEHTRYVSLEDVNGGDEQLWQIQPWLYDYSRMSPQC